MPEAVQWVLIIGGAWILAFVGLVGVILLLVWIIDRRDNP